MKPPFPEIDARDIGGDKDDEAKSDMDAVEPPPLFEQDEEQAKAQISRLRDVPFRMLVPNLITLGAICSGLTAVRLALESRFEFAIIAIVFAALLDALDGRVARFLKSTTSFGEQMDSLADFVNFGVAPALVLYIWALNEFRSFGWIVALFFAICGCLRLARFNVMLEEPDKPEWHVDFFTGVPAPAGALLVLLPLYLGMLDMEKNTTVTVLMALYTVFIGFLMVSNLPTWSGKRAGQRISPRLVVPVMMGLMIGVVVLFTYPWAVLASVSLIYLATLPFSYRDWHRRARRDATMREQDA